jgi:hypothetical protein
MKWAPKKFLLHIQLICLRLGLNRSHTSPATLPDASRRNPSGIPSGTTGQLRAFSQFQRFFYAAPRRVPAPPMTSALNPNPAPRKWNDQKRLPPLCFDARGKFQELTSCQNPRAAGWGLRFTLQLPLVECIPTSSEIVRKSCCCE